MVRHKVGSESNRKQNQSPFGQESGMHVYTPQPSAELAVFDEKHRQDNPETTS